MSTPTTEHVDLPITGMTCASCAARIEKKLNRLEGVDASVNYALERASVTYDPAQIAPEALVDTVRKAGYDAVVPAPPPPPGTPAGDEEHHAPTSDLGRRLVVAAFLRERVKRALDRTSRRSEKPT